MKCYHCGNEIKKGQMFCPSCGKEVQLVSPQSVLEDDFLDDFLDEGNSSRGKGRRSPKKWDDEDGNIPGKKQQKKLIIISLCVMIFVLGIVAILAWFLVYNSHANSLSYQMKAGSEAAEQGKDAAAIAHYERAIKLNRSNMEARLALGELYLRGKDYDSAQIVFQEAVNIDNKSVEAYKGLLRVFEEQKRYDEITRTAENITDPAMIKALSDYLIAPPVFSEKGGKYEDAVKLELTSDNGNEIYYTLDGRDPIQYGSKYKEAFSFADDGTYKVSAVCVGKKGVYSATVTEEYEVTIAAPDIPEVSPSGGNFGATTYVSVNVPENCTAYYTWDGTKPNVTSDRYTAPFTIPTGTNVLSVILVDNRTGKISEVFRGSYRYYD